MKLRALSISCAASASLVPMLVCGDATLRVPLATLSLRLSNAFACASCCCLVCLNSQANGGLIKACLGLLKTKTANRFNSLYL